MGNPRKIVWMCPNVKPRGNGDSGEVFATKTEVCAWSDVCAGCISWCNGPIKYVREDK